MSVSSNIHSSHIYSTASASMMEEDFHSSEYDIKLEAYMSSKKGQQSETNYDNYYVNGLCEKSFKFSDIERPYDTVITRCGIFAVSSGITSDRASKLLMRFLDEKKDFLTASNSVYQLKRRLAEVAAYCNKGLIDEGEDEGEVFEASLAIAVYFKEYLVYAICGDAAIMHIGKKRINRLKSMCGNLGLASQFRPFIGKCQFNKGDMTVLLSEGSMTYSSPEELCCQVVGDNNPQSVAARIVERTSYGNPKDSTCVAVSAEPPKGIYTKTLVIAGICLLWTLLNVLILILKE